MMGVIFLSLSLKERLTVSNQSFKPWVDIKSVLHLRWLAPFLTVPVLYVASVFIESWLQESGMIAYVPVGKRLIDLLNCKMLEEEIVLYVKD